MANLELGKIVEGTTLVPLVKLQDGYGCRCTVCGKGTFENGFNENGISMRYTKAALVTNKQSCRYCKFLARLQKGVTDIQQNTSYDLDWLLEKERRINNGELQLVRANDYYIATVPTMEDVDVYMQDFGKQVGDLQILGYVGKFKKLTATGIKYSKPESIVLICSICKSRTIVDYTTYNNLCKKSYTCVNNCKSILENINNSNKLKMASISRAKRIEEQRQMSERGISKLSNSTLDRFKASNKYKDLYDKIGKKYPNHEILDIEVTKEPSGKKSYDTIVVCKLCGSIMSIGSSERSVRKCSCEETPLVRGKLKQNYVNTVHNGLIVTEQLDNFMCNVKCFHCGNEIKNIPLYDVINDKYCCSCYEYEDLCDNCGAPVKFSVRDILLGKKCVCSKCNSDIDKDRVLHDIKVENTKFTFSRLHNGTAKGMQPVTTTFLKDKDTLYTGTNGVHYYRCFCMEHNKDLILTADEVKNYNHEKCNSLRSITLKKMTIDDFKSIRV